MQATSNDSTKRPPPNNSEAKWNDSEMYLPDPELIELMRLSARLRLPLLITGAPGCGKTGAAYYAARTLWGLSRHDLIHHQIRSSETTERLRYEFDDVKYFRDSQQAAAGRLTWREDPTQFIKPGPVWLAFEAIATRRIVLLFDEIDKAPRDFPNDLLHEFDARAFWVPELSRAIEARIDSENLLWIVTSNGERDLPGAFLRRCVHHHIELGPDEIKRILDHRIGKGDIQLEPSVIERAVERFHEISALEELRHRPGLAELIVWLKGLSIAEGRDDDATLKALASKGIASLPLLGLLLKDPVDLKAVA